MNKAIPPHGATQVVKRITIIQGHPDAAGHHLLNAMAEAYAEGATSSGHQVRRIEVAKLDFTLLRTQADFETGELPPTLVQPRDDMRWAEHWLFLFPLWHGTMPPLHFSGAYLPIRLCHGIQREALPKTSARRALGEYRH